MFKASFAIFIILLFGLNSYSQTKAITDNGEEVILNSDGTWKYADIKSGYDTRIDTINYVKDKKSTFLVKSKKIPFGIWIDPKKWSFKPNTQEDLPIEYVFTLKGQDAYAMIVTERIEVGYMGLKGVILSNLQKSDPNARITREEMRSVNGVVMEYLELKATIKGSPFVYVGYFYTGDIGTVQFQTFTSEKLLSTYKKEMELLLNGAVLIK